MEKVKLIRGSEERAEEVRKTLEEWGGVNKNNLSFEYEDVYYYLDQIGLCRCIDEKIARKLISEGKAEIYELPTLKPKCTLKPFQKVLCRQTDDSVWECDIFSHIRNNEKYTSRYGCVGSYWAFCIPYEGNEALLGTTNNPK